MTNRWVKLAKAPFMWWLYFYLAIWTPSFIIGLEIDKVWISQVVAFALIPVVIIGRKKTG